jgi:hypothetical protein
VEFESFDAEQLVPDDGVRGPWHIKSLAGKKAKPRRVGAAALFGVQHAVRC